MCLSYSSQHPLKVTLLWQSGLHTTRLFQRKSLQILQLLMFLCNNTPACTIHYSWNVRFLWQGLCVLYSQTTSPHPHVAITTLLLCIQPKGLLLQSVPWEGHLKCSLSELAPLELTPAWYQKNVDVRRGSVLLGKFVDLNDHQSPHLWNGENNTCPSYLTGF